MTGAGICLGLAVALVAGALLASSHSSNSHSSSKAARPTVLPDAGSSACVLGTAHLCDVNGVRSTLGQPTRTQGNCLVYRIDKTGLRLNVAPEADAVKFCFSPSGALTEEWGHNRGFWVPEPIFQRPAVAPQPSQL